MTIEEQPEDYGVATLQRRGKSTPNNENDEISVEKFGVEVADATPDLAKSFGYKGTMKGVIITDVAPNSIAAEAGLRRGMVITKVDRKPVESASQARDMLEKSSSRKGLVLQVQYPDNLGGGAGYILLKPETADK